MPVICVFALDRATGTGFYRIKGNSAGQVRSCRESALKFDNPTNRYNESDAQVPETLALAKPDLMRVSIGYALSEGEFDQLNAVSVDVL